jgi:iron complex outermembrane receptor protein
VTGPPTFDAATGFWSRNYDFTWHAVTGTLGVQFQPDESTLLYLRYARGYKAGGFNVGIATALGPFPWTDAEHSDAYEVGLKRNWGRTFQLNAAIYYYNYLNAQVPVTIANNTGGVGVSTAVFFNVPAAISMGFELETIWSPIPDLQILFNYALNDAHVTRACCVVDPADPTARDPLAHPSGPAGGIDASTGQLTQAQDLRGNHMPNAPLNKISVNVNYTWHFEPGDLTASANYIWRDAQYETLFSRSYTRSPPWDQVDARLVWRASQNRYTIIASVRNVFNSITYSGGAGAARRGNGSTITGATLAPTSIVSAYPLSPPRTINLEVQYRFF